MLGRSISLLTPGEQAGEVISILARISAGKAVTNHETTRLRKDGTSITVSLTTSPHLTDDGAVVGASEIYRDLTHHT
jgi:PAS domain S-box-containing protein